MIYASKGTSILWDKEHLVKSKEASGLNILSISQTYKIRCDIDKNSDKKDSGIVKKSINGISNYIHNLAIIIDMMQDIINKENSLYSKSNLYLGVLLESYYTNLRSIFDFLPNIIRIGLDESQIKQLPQKDSYNNLLKYVKMIIIRINYQKY